MVVVQEKDKQRIIAGTLLTAFPSYLTGMARVLDLFASLDSYKLSNHPDQHDAEAIYSDWQAVGLDLVRSVVEAEGKRLGALK